MAGFQDKEIEQYRDLMSIPDRFESGFGLKSVLGALFLGFLMLPGSIYLSLVMGASLGPAARWVTVILFAEVARRSMKGLRQQEIFILFYMTGILLGGGIGGQLHGGMMMVPLWNQYLVQSPATSAMGIDIPSWVAPSKDILEQSGRTFFTQEWMVPIFFLGGLLLLGRIDQFGLGYALYRWTSHVEKLPFPMAPADALGITALAESGEGTHNWRWRWFSIGGVIGLGFGFIYVGVPAISGAVFNAPIQVIPIPFVDMTPKMSTEQFMPATPMNLVFDLSLVVLGMVLPFWAVVGSSLALVVMLVLNPVLYKIGYLTTWTPGMSLVRTVFSNSIDFYLSFGIGMALAIFIVSITTVGWSLVRRNRTAQASKDSTQDQGNGGSLWKVFRERNRERGDMSIVVALCIYVCSTVSYILICLWLMPGDPVTGQGRFPWLFFLCFGFLYQPLMSYVNAKLEGLVGQTVQIPMVREAAFILSGYSGSRIWFAPIPMNDYAIGVRGFRVMELNGTRLSSLVKTEILVIPIVIATTLIFSHYIWRLAEVPSDVYPFAQELWELQALNFCLTATATLDGSSPFIEAIKPGIIGWGLGTGMFSFILLSILGLPTFLVYGFVRGLGAMTPGHIVPEMVGALIGRFFLQRKFGHQTYKRYVMVMFAGMTAGVGLIGMASVAIALIAKSTTTLRY